MIFIVLLGGLIFLSLFEEISATTATLTSSLNGTTCPDFVPPAGVGLEDLQVVANLWRASTDDPDSDYDPAYDLNDDGVINIEDIVQVVVAMGTCESLAVFAGAADIADCSREEDEATAVLLDNIPGTVFTVGDNAYPNGTVAQFNNCYEPTWGRHKARTHPAAGDNEYNSSSVAVGYFGYFGAAAGDPDKGYYSYDVGSWHIIVLNSNCSQIGGCDPTSPQGQWLQADLVANPRTCILAIHHEPLFSSNGGDADLRDFWVPLYEAGADIVLSGHRHLYERFAQQNPDGVADPGRGIRQFVVGTGGASLSSLDGVAANSEVRDDNTHGVLMFTLHPTSYDWEFIPIAGQTFTDSGSAQCVTP